MGGESVERLFVAYVAYSVARFMEGERARRVELDFAKFVSNGLYAVAKLLFELRVLCYPATGELPEPELFIEMLAAISGVKPGMGFCRELAKRLSSFGCFEARCFHRGLLNRVLVLEIVKRDAPCNIDICSTVVSVVRELIPSCAELASKKVAELFSPCKV